MFARGDGSVLDCPQYAAAADGGVLLTAAAADFIPIPKGTLLLTLPGRSPLGFDAGERVALHDFEGAPIDAVAAALPLGYTRTLLPAFAMRRDAPPLPLYGYAAVAWHEGRLCVAGLLTDQLETWSSSAHDPEPLRRAVAMRLLQFPGSPQLRQLERCALEYGCYTAQNTFLRQGEAAITVSPACNARCIGCISEQEPEAGIASAQERVRETAAADDIARLAVAHLESATHPIVSFGQGCEGEPLLAAPRIAAAIRKIRKTTQRGTLHINTNASRPAALAQLLEAGLQSVRVSLNSARPATYAAYYRPRGYGFDDVVQSLEVARRAGASVSLNLLTHPGVTDDPDEMQAFGALLRDHPVDMVQSRTLNVDPSVYFEAVGRPKEKPVGMRAWFAWLRSEFPRVRVGNFTRGFG